MVRDVLKNSGINYVEVANEAAFYGPKIDVQVYSVIGREFTLATNQVDFASPGASASLTATRTTPRRFPVHPPRPLGTHERFIGFLIEHYAGNFPLWLAPEQVRVLTIGEDEPLVNYAKAIVQELRANMVRAEGEYTNDKINGKIQQAELARSTPCSWSASATWPPTPSASASTAKAASARSPKPTPWRRF